MILSSDQHFQCREKKSIVFLFATFKLCAHVHTVTFNEKRKLTLEVIAPCLFTSKCILEHNTHFKFQPLSLEFFALLPFVCNQLAPYCYQARNARLKCAMKYMYLARELMIACKNMNDTIRRHQ